MKRGIPHPPQPDTRSILDSAPATFQARATGASFASCSARSSGPMRARSSAALTGSRLATGPRARGIPLIPLNPRRIPPQKKSPIPWTGQIGRVPDGAGGRRPPLLGAPRACATCAGEGRKCRAMMRDADTASHGTSVKVDPSLSSNYMAAESAARAAGHLSERESVFCIRFLKGLKSPARSTAYSVPGAPVWQARALRPAGPSLRLKRIYRRSGGLPIVPAAVSGCSSLSAAMISAIRVFTSLIDASRGL